MDEGPCQKVHSENLKADFQKSRDVHAYDSLIEREFNNRINEADRVIKVTLKFGYKSVTCLVTVTTSLNTYQKARARVEEEKTDETINPEINPDILRIHADMSRVINAAEAAGLEGNIDTVQVNTTQNHLRIEPS